jgi:hypothetical protein
MYPLFQRQGRVATYAVAVVMCLVSDVLRAQARDTSTGMPEWAKPKHFYWIVDTASLSEGPTKLIHRPGKKPQDVILVSRSATPEDLLSAFSTYQVTRGRAGDTVTQKHEILPQRMRVADTQSELTKARLGAMRGYLHALRESSPQMTEDFGMVRLAVFPLHDRPRVKSKPTKP